MMPQYCRYCAFCFHGDVYYCNAKETVLRKGEIIRANQCRDYAYSELGDVDTGQPYRPQPSRRNGKVYGWMKTQEVKTVLESEFEIELETRNFDTSNCLIKWGKPHIDIRWCKDAENQDRYNVDVWAKENGQKRDLLYSSYYSPITMEEMLRQLGRFLPKRKKPQQIKLF